ncbi:sigma-70 family RNA polymerase sigma factor [Lacihabitans sp. LS3-19]|uniref:RNA polymerase sigma factor n=1 Tax=Lacihabitans sp. LS3-19 TaxID=2487335 RepID=UPI0020CD207D|nr:sigma-70 family RNA polymerase sigma factor [Lacihabitans sp. LS3-19]MCP9767095.1 sigma-70 family RNA polymerase sigma factor [Lacihabitans sp. LS3-19]
MNLKFNDFDIVAGLLSRDTKICNDIIEYLYFSEKKKIYILVKKNNGTLADAEDLFQNVVLDFVESVWSLKFKLLENTKISTYLFTVAYNQWKKHLNREGKKMKWEAGFSEMYFSEQESSPIDLVVEKEELLNYSEIFNSLGEICRQILNAFYNEKMSINEITLAFDFANENATKVRKFRCMKNLSTLINKQK